MADDHKTFQLRYVGARFDGARLPLDVLSDLPAFRDLLVAYAKDQWRAANADRERLPRGFDKSISFDLVAVHPGSAVAQLDWDRDTAQSTLPSFTDELGHLVGTSYGKLIDLIDQAGNRQFPQALSSEHIRALNKLGSGLRDGERIEFVGSIGANDNVVYLDTVRRKALITHVTDRYQTRYEGFGRLLGSNIEGYIDVETSEHGKVRIDVAPDRVVDEFDGYINSDVQFALRIELDNTDTFKNVIEVFDVDLVDEEIADNLTRCRTRLAELSRIQAGWLDGSGAAVDAAAVAAAESFLSKRPFLATAYRIYPTMSGGILFEFERNGWDFSVEFNVDGSIEMYGVQINGEGEMQPHNFSLMNDEFISLFDARTNA
jgi:hypothetical protein